MADAVEQVAQNLPDLLSNKAAVIARPADASPYFTKVLEGARESLAQSDESTDPFIGLKRKTEVKLVVADTAETALEQLGDLTGALPTIPVGADRAAFNRRSDMAVLLSQVKTKQAFDALPFTRAGKAQMLDTLIDYLNGYPAFAAKLRGMNPGQRRAFAQGLITDEVIQNMRTKLDGELRKPTAWSSQKELPAIVTDFGTRKTKIDSTLTAVATAMMGGVPTAFTLDENRLKSITFPETSDFVHFNLSTLDPTVPANMTVERYAIMQRGIHEPAVRVALGFGLGALSAARQKQVNDQVSLLVQGDLHALYVNLQESKRLAGLVDSKTAERNTRKSEFANSLDSMAGEAVAVGIERAVTSAETDLRTKLEEAQTEDEAKAQSVLDVIDTAWKKKYVGKDGITTYDISRKEVRRLKKVLFKDGTDGVFAWALANADASTEQIAAINRMMQENPNNERLQELKTTVGSLVMRDYFRSGGKMSEKQMNRLVNSDQNMLVDIIKNGLSKVDGAKKQVRDVFGDEINGYLEGPGFVKRLKDKFGVRGVMAILAIALGVGGLVYASPILGQVLAGVGIRGTLLGAGALQAVDTARIGLQASTAAFATSALNAAGTVPSALGILPGLAVTAGHIAPSAAATSTLLQAAGMGAGIAAGAVATGKVVSAAVGK